MKARTPHILALCIFTLACLALAGTTYALVVRAEEPKAGSVECKKTATPTERPTNTATPEPTMTSTLWTPVPPVTPTRKPPQPPTATPTPQKDRPEGDLCIYPDNSIGELFTLENWLRYHDNPERLERYVIRETTNGSCIRLLAGAYALLWWNEKTGHGGRTVTVTVHAGNHQEVRE